MYITFPERCKFVQGVNRQNEILNENISLDTLFVKLCRQSRVLMSSLRLIRSDIRD